MIWEEIHPVQAVFRSMPAPRDVVAHLVDHDKGPVPFWTVRLYRDDFENNTAEDKLAIFNWVSDVIRTIRTVEPECYVEIYERAPR